MTVGETIRQYRKQQRVTLQALGEAVGVSKQTVQRYESGVIAQIPYDKIEAIAARLGLPPSRLLGWSEPPRPARGLPILGRISCGEPVYAEESYDGYVPPSEELSADFCLIARGDSMIGARICDGDAVLIHRQDRVEDGEIAAVAVDDEATLKRVFYDQKDQKIILSPENSKYAPFVFVGDEASRVRILGRAVAFISRMD
ncbi:MAG: helix-turn-helix domain-containing protein [Clostridia bacterium]|nr:helix-turn-helix domain-containing protein [Clostridia bacterium]